MLIIMRGYCLLGLLTLIVCCSIFFYAPRSFQPSCSHRSRQKRNSRDEVISAYNTIVQLVISKRGQADLMKTLKQLSNRASCLFGSLGVKSEYLGCSHVNADCKGFINFNNQDGFKCNAVVIGIGESVDAQIDLISKVNTCRLIGADPIMKHGSLIKSIGGEFVHAAVSNVDNEEQIMRVLNDDQKYENRKIKVKSLERFLYEIGLADESVIDFMFIDIEGSEFNIFPYFVLDDPMHQAMHSTICQLSIEVHLSPNETARLLQEERLLRFVTGSNFVLVWSYQPWLNGDLVRMFMIDISNVCIDRFLPSVFYK